MARIFVHVEGQTEETFVNEILAPHLWKRNHYPSAVLIGAAGATGGICAWHTARREITNFLKTDTTAVVTTMVDYYGLPQTGGGAWPGRSNASAVAFQLKAETVHQALIADVASEMGKSFFPVRFIPYVMMHEFEGLLFSDCTRFASGIGQTTLAAAFQKIRDQFATPEEINDSPLSAPSKRVNAIVPGYQKPYLGILAALEIGLDAIRSECPHFNAWLTSLEALP
jgi:hypothetical protein